MNNDNAPFLKKSLVLAVSILLIMPLATSLQARSLIFQSSSSTAGSSAGSAGSANESVSQLSTKPLPGAQDSESVAVQTTAQGLPSSTGSFSANQSASANSELFFMLEQLQQEVNTLRGIVEEQGHELRMLKQSSRDRYVDMDARVLDLTKRVSEVTKGGQMMPSNSNSSVSAVSAVQVNNEGVTGKPVVSAPVSTTQVAKTREPTKAENDAYASAYTFIKDKKFDDAILALFSYTENYPDSPLLPNVYYWLGEVYLATSKLEQAKTSFTLVMTAYPDNSKVSDAHYKLAVTHDRLGQKDQAKQMLMDVQKKYPNTSAAKLAASYTLSP